MDGRRAQFLYWTRDPLTKDWMGMDEEEKKLSLATRHF